MERINPFGQVQSCGQLAHLGVAQRDAHLAVLTGIILGDGHTFGEGANDHILLQRCAVLIHEGDHSAVEFMLNGKHTQILSVDL